MNERLLREKNKVEVGIVCNLCVVYEFAIFAALSKIS